MAPPVTTTICPTLYKDLPQMLDIYNHFVSNTVVTFNIDPQPLSYVVETYHSVLDQGLPHFVVAARKYPQDDNDDNKSEASDSTQKILGYAYATQYRPRPAYSGTVELSIYLSPGSTGHGTGEKLLAALIEALKAVPQNERRPHGIREVLAVTAVSKDNDARSFYVMEGFEQVGRMNGVGWKMGRWVDCVNFQLSLSGGKENDKRAEDSGLVAWWWPFGPFAWEVWSG